MQDYDPTISNLSPIAKPSPSSELQLPEPIYDMIVVQPPLKIVGYESHIATNSVEENTTFYEAINGPNKIEWIKAMNYEINSI
jgi:hypothetical protein